jgi:hypothetical protein
MKVTIREFSFFVSEIQTVIAIGPVIPATAPTID